MLPQYRILDRSLIKSRSKMRPSALRPEIVADLAIRASTHRRVFLAENPPHSFQRVSLAVLYMTHLSVYTHVNDEVEHARQVGSITSGMSTCRRSSLFSGLMSRKRKC